MLKTKTFIPVILHDEKLSHSFQLIRGKNSIVQQEPAQRRSDSGRPPGTAQMPVCMASPPLN